ncbi:hypothetical protein FQ192_13940 [Pseudomonas sp. ANT_J12]|nr:hypothetical protein FQ192_13940 [Pseudomonas sp. ANT_J12]
MVDIPKRPIGGQVQKPGVVCADVFAGKPRSYRLCVVAQSMAHAKPVGARLARESVRADATETSGKTDA